MVLLMFSVYREIPKVIPISDVIPDPEELQAMDTVVLVVVITFALREILKLWSDATYEMASLGKP